MVSLRKNEAELADEVMEKISLSKDKVNLEKHVVNLTKCMVDISKKKEVDLGSTRAKVVVVLDYSGSMKTLFKNGTVQKTLNRLVPLGLTFDDNGAIDVYLFQYDYKKLDFMDLKNYENYVTEVIDKADYKMGGTCYAPVLEVIINGGRKAREGLLGKLGFTKKIDSLVDNGDPTFILFITDGANSDKGKTNEILRKASEMNVFIQFIGIGKEDFDYLKKLDTLKGRTRDNTGFTKMSDLSKASDQVLYTAVLEEFAGWLRGEQ